MKGGEIIKREQFRKKKKKENSDTGKGNKESYVPTSQ
jgi:hypothetical protein